MLRVLIKFLTLQVENVHPFSYLGVAVVWILLLVSSISSLRSIEVSKPEKIAWFALILFLPILGLALYCLRCLSLADWSFLSPILSKPKQVLPQPKQ